MHHTLDTSLAPAVRRPTTGFVIWLAWNITGVGVLWLAQSLSSYPLVRVVMPGLPGVGDHGLGMMMWSLLCSLIVATIVNVILQVRSVLVIRRWDVFNPKRQRRRYLPN